MTESKRFVLNTLHDPIEVQIGEKVIRFKPVTLGGLAKLEKLETGESSISELQAELASLVDGDPSALNDVPVGDIHQVINFVIKSSFGHLEIGPEKNGSGPGPT